MLLSLGALAISLLMAIVGWRARMAPPDQSRWPSVLATSLMYLAPAAAVLATLYILTDPTYVRQSDGVLERLTYLDVNGNWALVPLLIPVALSWVPVWRWENSRRLALPAVMGALLAVYTGLTGFTIGGFYVPSAWLLALAAVAVYAGRERGLPVPSDEPAAVS